MVSDKNARFVFTSKLTNKTVEIPILDDDIIIDGQLRRIVRDRDGEIPEWVRPALKSQDYMRISPDGTVYGKYGKKASTLHNGKYSIMGQNNGKKGSLSVLKALSILFTDSEIEQPFNDRPMSEGFDITTINNIEFKLANSVGTYGFNSGKNGISIFENGKHKKSYHAYQMMHFRCSDEYKKLRPNSPGLIVADDLADAQDFIPFYDEIYHEFNANEQMSLDGYIMSKVLNKSQYTYSKETCLILPHSVKMFFSHTDGPLIGVTARPDGRFEAYTSEFYRPKNENRKVYLRCWDTPEQAHQAYIEYKNWQLKELVIPYYISIIPNELTGHPMVSKVKQALQSFEFK